MKTLYFILPFLISTNCFCQSGQKLHGYLSFQGNATLYDRTITNNRSGFGIGFQTLLNTKTFLKPILETNADLLVGTKEGYMTPDGRLIHSKNGILSVYVGSLFHLTKRIFLSATAGPHYFNREVYFGVRPAIGFYPSKKMFWTLKASFTNVFHRDDISRESFGYLSFALAGKIF